MKRYISILLLALLCSAGLCGCGVSAEKLAGKGIYAEKYSSPVLTQKIEAALLSGEDSFDAVYLGKIRSIDDTENRTWESGYICSRFAEQVEAEYDQFRGYVNAYYTITPSDAGLLEAMPRENGGLKVYPLECKAVEECIMDMIFRHAETALYLFENRETLQEFDRELMSFIEKVQRTNYACEYAASEIRWIITDYGDTAEVQFSMKYVEGRPRVESLPVVQTGRELFDALIEVWKSDLSATAAVIMEGMDLTEKEVTSVIAAAEVNCGTVPCESKNIWHVQFVRQNDRQIVAAWMEMPLAEEELLPLQRELASEVYRRSEKIRERHSEEEKLYRAAYREVISASQYDEELAEATLDDELTPRMHVYRTAYGALVRGRTVCTGYAGAYKALCDELGLECYVVLGHQDGGEHAWNRVMLNGQWRYVDCTYGDTGGGSEYCLFDSDDMGAFGYHPDEAFETDSLYSAAACLYG